MDKWLIHTNEMHPGNVGDGHDPPVRSLATEMTASGHILLRPMVAKRDEQARPLQVWGGFASTDEPIAQLTATLRSQRDGQVRPLH